MSKENSLALYSVNPLNERERLISLPKDKAVQELAQNFRAYENEVLKDLPVSIKYSWRLDETATLASHIDKREREGLTFEGFMNLSQLLRQRPHEVILWYSPPGKASYSYDSSNPYSDITFTYGQLYLQYFDGEWVHAAAVKLNHKEALQEVIPSLYFFSKSFSQEKDRVSFFLKHPLSTSQTIDEFLSQKRENVPVYKDKNGRVSSLSEILLKIRAAFGIRSSDQDHAEFLAQKIVEEGTTKEGIFRAYILLINQEMEATGKSYIQLSGSCGGRMVTRDSIESLLGLGSPLQNLYSTDVRLFAEEDLSTHYPDYECPHCGRVLSGEKKSDKSSWRPTCEHCGGKLSC